MFFGIVVDAMTLTWKHITPVGSPILGYEHPVISIALYKDSFLSHVLFYADGKTFRIT